MTDRAPATIFIGGDLTDEQCREIAEIACNLELGPDWGVVFRKPQDVLQHIRNAAKDENPLILKGRQCVHGRMTPLTGYLISEDIVYIHHNDPTYAVESEIESNWPSGEDEPLLTTPSNSNGDPLVSWEDVSNAWKAGEMASLEKKMRSFDTWRLPCIELEPAPLLKA